MPTKMLPRPQRHLLIGTQPPSRGGGVLTLLRAFVRWVRQEPGLVPALAYPPADRSDPVNAGPLSWLGGRWRPGVRQESWEDIPATCIGRFLPSLESLSGFGTRSQWRQLMDPIDLHQVICGYAVTGLPQALSGRRFVAWVATSMEGDKRARLCHFDPARRIAHSLQHRLLLRLERFVLRRAAWVFALSPHTHAELLERGAARERTSVLPCPVDVDAFTPAEQEPPAPTILWAGRHDDPRKNTQMLVRAFARIAPSLPQARLLLVGEVNAETLPRMAAALGLADRVEFLGYQPDDALPAIYRRASVFAIPSDQEGLCIAGLEAMACGLPVVSTRCGGSEAFVHHGETGLLVPRHAEDDLAEALHHLLTDEGARRRLGGQARALVERDYSFPTFAAHLRRIYSQVWPEVFCADSPPVADRPSGPPGPPPLERSEV